MEKGPKTSQKVKGKGKSKSLNHRNQSIEKIAPDVLGYNWREGPYKLKSHDGYKEFYEKHNPNVDRYRYYFYFPIVYSDCSLSGYFDPNENSSGNKLMLSRSHPETMLS